MRRVSSRPDAEGFHDYQFNFISEAGANTYLGAGMLVTNTGVGTPTVEVKGLAIAEGKGAPVMTKVPAIVRQQVAQMIQEYMTVGIGRAASRPGQVRDVRRLQHDARR